MAYPYKKMTEEDFARIRSFTADDRVWTGQEIAKEYYHDEMPEYGSYPPELYVEVINKEEVSAIMAYAYKENIPVVCRGAGTGLAGPFALAEIEAVRLDSGAPAYRFSGRTAEWVARRRLTAHLTLSHDGGMAMAFCLLEAAPDAS